MDALLVKLQKFSRVPNPCLCTFTCSVAYPGIPKGAHLGHNGDKQKKKQGEETEEDDEEKEKKRVGEKEKRKEMKKR